ncbi:flagellar hook assembly protein FlgD [Stenotrophobium rhamnosiphilum]|uniref:Basal-body rod modification protein FlgD n=1 Tax=Stenotrophobium rhamnosiphilum TaxID=2029166 RepID=A0A2T5MDF5_9GAMM|nr:flagellar hook assembly protein FlgD [Stenotrophobium rhamnosiphilum]PTU30605.1 flagellar hook capping protein [Stenotrophobium rhamnosiphilum]
MSAIGSVGSNSSTNNVTSALQAQTLTQNDFLKLMTSQLKNQDPLKPLDNSEFVSQMAQFSTVSGIQNLQNSFSTLASSLSSGQALQASSLVGHNVLTSSSKAVLSTGGKISLAVDAPASGNVIVNVTDSSGQLIRRIDLGAQASGLTQFQWDGIDNNGAAAPAGQYNFTATVGTGSQSQAATMLAAGKVNSVSLDSSGALNLSVDGIGSVAFSTIRQIS